VTKTKNKTRMPETSQYAIGYQDKMVARVKKELAIIDNKMIKSIVKRMKGISLGAETASGMILAKRITKTYHHPHCC
jgi:hypothetical protein